MERGDPERPTTGPSAAAWVSLRVARPTNDIEALLRFYRDGLGLALLARFAGHAGFDGAIVGPREGPWHLEFVVEAGVAAPRAPSPEHLLVLYMGDVPRAAAVIERMQQAGYQPVSPHNPYWHGRAVLFEDPDGYRIAVHAGPWPPV